MGSNEWERQRDSKWQRQRGRMGAIYGKKMQVELWIWIGKLGEMFGKVWKGRTLRLGSHPQSVLKGAERRVGDGLTAGGSFIFLPVSPPPHPSVSSTASGHLPPSKVFVSLLQHTLLFFYSFLSYVCLPSHASLSSLLIDSGTAAQSGVRASHNQQHAWDSLHCLACFHRTPGKLWRFAYKAFLLSFHCILLLLCSLILSPYYLFFVITMRLSHPLPLIFSAG